LDQAEQWRFSFLPPPVSAGFIGFYVENFCLSMYNSFIRKER